MAEETPIPTPALAPPAVTLDRILVALQKSFSRVSAASVLTEKLKEGDARALIMGNVNFDLSLTLEPEPDYLRYSPAGRLTLRLNGVIQQDVRPAQRIDPPAPPMNTNIPPTL